MLAITQVINKILQTKDYSFIRKNCLDASYFKGFEKEYNFIENHYKMYGNIPDAVTFLEKFPNFNLVEVNESDKYLLDRLYEEYSYQKFADAQVVNTLAKLLEQDSREAYNYLRDQLPKLQPHIALEGLDIIKDAKERYEIYKNRATEPEKATIKSGLPELDDIFNGWEMGEELVTVVARTNMGKCLQKGTKVIMEDGSLKEIQDIKVGDKVQSLNKSNTVLGVHKGKSKGYKIIPLPENEIEPFVVSEGHILTLVYINQLVDISIEDYLARPDKFHFFLYRISGGTSSPAFLLFKVEEVEEVEYYGFECDGDHRFLLSNGIVTHNSWLLMKFLAEAWKQGKRVGLYSGEMNHIKLGYRFDSLFEHYSNKCLTQGWSVEGYKEYIDKLMQSTTSFYIVTQKQFGGRPTVPKLRNFLEANQLDILGVDQYSLVDDHRSIRDPLRIKLAHISEDLFSLSTEYGIPIIGLSQANRQGATKESEDQAPNLENIKESDDIAHNSSKAIGMKQSSYGLVLDIIKNREGKVGDKLFYSWDIDTGHFSYIPAQGDAAKPERREEVQKQTKEMFADSINPF